MFLVIRLTLASKLKMSVVAEGIETEEQNDQLRKFGCEYGQGFLFSKPLDARHAAELIEAEWRRLVDSGMAFEPKLDESVAPVSVNYAM